MDAQCLFIVIARAFVIPLFFQRHRQIKMSHIVFSGNFQGPGEKLYAITPVMGLVIGASYKKQQASPRKSYGSNAN